ncbi:hypothetical protein [Halomarina rubra]|uniref:Uncharacterized protein n=1 Tax=Halomarina rubra TaxID=2071873 RepID=A0ABD6AU68_9EURY|nr:hypothetical protein [Halomarina rubra]
MATAIPFLSGETEGGRHATWLELFFDRVVVLAVLAERERRPTDAVDTPEAGTPRSE